MDRILYSRTGTLATGFWFIPFELEAFEGQAGQDFLRSLEIEMNVKVDKHW